MAKRSIRNRQLCPWSCEATVRESDDRRCLCFALVSDNLHLLMSCYYYNYYSTLQAVFSMSLSL